MELCPKCNHMTAERDNYTDELKCYNIDCFYSEGDSVDLEQEELFPLEHKSLDVDRLEWVRGSELEKAFAKKWEALNAPNTGCNFNMGILQDLMVRQDQNYKIDFWITQREATIVATIVQWLGTNVGFGFLLSVFDDVGMTLQPARWFKQPTPPTRKRELLLIEEE